MPTFRQLRETPGERPPPLTILLPPDAYASDYERRPLEPVAVGVRLLSESDAQAARSAAAKTALDLFPDDALDERRGEAYRDALVRELVARATCDPNDVRAPFFSGDEEEVRLALTADGCRFIWDAVERLAAERSPLAPSAADDEVDGLPDAWRRCLPMLPQVRQQYARRLLGHVLKSLADAELDGATLDEEG